MSFSPRVSEVLGWAMVVGLAFYAADASCATAECRLSTEPAPLLSPSPEFRKVARAVPGQLEALLTSSKQELVAAAQESQEANSPGVTWSQAQFVLAGTLADDRGRGLALLSQNGNPPEVVPTGEKIGGWTLVKVGHQQAELRRAGETRSIDFLAPVTLPVPSEEANGEVSKLEPSTPANVEPIRTRSELRALLSGSDATAQHQGSLRPYFHEGEIQGYLVRVKDPHFPLARLGIADRDVVTSVNGVPCTGTESLSEIYRVLRNALTIRLELQRGGEPISLVVNLEE